MATISVGSGSKPVGILKGPSGGTSTRKGCSSCGRGR